MGLKGPFKVNQLLNNIGSRAVAVKEFPLR